MKSYNSIELEVGQEVIMAMAHGRNSGASLAKGVIVRLTPQMAVITSRGGEFRKLPDKIVVVR